MALENFTAKARYDIGEKVWFISGNKVLVLEVTGVRFSVESADECKVEYILHYDWHQPEGKLFRSKKELLESLLYGKGICF